MKESAEEHTADQNEGARDPFLRSTPGKKLEVLDLERLDLFALTAVGRRERGIRFAQLGGFGADLVQLASQRRGFGLELRQAKGGRGLRFQIARWNPTRLALARPDPSPTLTSCENGHFVAGLDRTGDLELRPSAGAEIQFNVAPDPSGIR